MAPARRTQSAATRVLLAIAAVAVVPGCGPSADKSAPPTAPTTPVPGAPFDSTAAIQPPRMASTGGERRAEVAATTSTGASAKDAGAASSAAVPGDPAALRGKVAFESKCAPCHTIAGGDKVGPDLHGVTKLLGAAWIERWLRDPAPMLASDPHAKAQLAKYQVPMPKPDLGGEEIRDVLAYLTWADATLPGSAPAPSHDHAGHQHGTK